MSFWDRMMANPGKNYDALGQTNTQLTHLRKSVSKVRRGSRDNQGAINKLNVKLAEVQTELEATQAQHAELLDTLTRCLFANKIIEPADLAAMLPASEVQDDGSDQI